MNHTQNRKRKVATMPAHALALSFRCREYDRRDARRMAECVRQAHERRTKAEASK